MNTSILTHFYRCTIESLLTGSFTVWYGNCSMHSQKNLQRVVEAAKTVTGNSLPAVQDIYTQTCLWKAWNIIKDHSYPACRLFSLLQSGRQYWSMAACTMRLRDSTYDYVIELLTAIH